MTDKERYEKIATMCREILDTEEPFYWHYDLSRHEKDLAVDALLRAVLGLTEGISLEYVEEKFYSAYNRITKKKVYPY